MMRNNKYNLEDTPCGFRPRLSTTDQIFSLQQIFEKVWDYAKDVYVCFVDLEKAFDRVPQEKLLRSVAGARYWRLLVMAVKSLYSCSEVCVRVGGVKVKTVHRGCGAPPSVCVGTRAVEPELKFQAPAPGI